MLWSLDNYSKLRALNGAQQVGVQQVRYRKNHNPHLSMCLTTSWLFYGATEVMMKILIM